MLGGDWGTESWSFVERWAERIGRIFMVIERGDCRRVFGSDGREDWG